jgi:AbrB family looped-hinge helix DNA binding protein
MTHRIGTKGQVVIPKALREQTGLQAGVEVDFELRDGDVVIHRHNSGRTLMGSLKGGPSMAQELLEDRAREPR